MSDRIGEARVLHAFCSVREAPGCRAAAILSSDMPGSVRWGQVCDGKGYVQDGRGVQTSTRWAERAVLHLGAGSHDLGRVLCFRLHIFPQTRVDDVGVYSGGDTRWAHVPGRAARHTVLDGH